MADVTVQPLERIEILCGLPELPPGIADRAKLEKLVDDLAAAISHPQLVAQVGQRNPRGLILGAETHRPLGFG